ncbi:hypothetical protein MHU86_10760 [Fragilaria crotonensis]|nr:hypothetical protein MHU86_10760 [Fragilaria crotonensis]
MLHTPFAQSRRTEHAHRIMQRHDLYKRGRGFPLSCLSFGEHRKTEYPDFFFCHGCDLLEDAVRIGAKRAHREQKKYWCTAGHTNLLHPTRKKKPYRPNLKAPASTAASIPGGATVAQLHEGSSTTKDDSLFSTTTVLSQISPCKKKQRREPEGSAPVILQNAKMCWHADQEKGTSESSAIAASLVVTPSCSSVGLSHESCLIKEKELMECIDSLKIKNILLEKKIAELDSSIVNLTTQVEILTLQMEGVQFPTSRREACDSTRNTTARPEKHFPDHADNEGSGGRSAPQQGRRHRIQIENDEISEKLALALNDFVNAL